MQRALDLAKLGQGYVAPNPMVGCVIVKNNQIIGEGWHKNYGGPHAEVNAIQSIDNHLSAEGSEVYVTLEPCSHHGKTPPCADLLINQKVKKVIICNLDPNPLVAGKGIQKLINAGIIVETGMLAEKGNHINTHFFTFHNQKRPFITLKFASSEDQLISKPNGEAVQFSNEMSKTFVHRMRTHHQAILIGANTANWDNPQLTNRNWPGPTPLRLILDPNNRLNSQLTILTDEHPTWIFTNDFSKEDGNKIWFAMHSKNADAFLKIVMQTLHEKNIQSVLVEGGTFTLQKFLDADLFDEINQIVHNEKLGAGIAAPKIPIEFQEKQRIGIDNHWKIWRRNYIQPNT
ncbi:MAG: Diaminohydroxyphosphoribosylaminopyrimidine deaminase [Bacteroidota bacterium]